MSYSTTNLALHTIKSLSSRFHYNLCAQVQFVQGVICSAFGVYVKAWCIQKKGDVFTGVFSPLCTVSTVLLEYLLLHVSLYLGRKLSPIGKVAFWRGFVVNRERVFFGQCGLSDGRLAVGFSGIAKLFEDGGKLFTGDTSGLCGTLWWQSVFE
ncbi:uncharacterized protein LOC131062846 isoform X2 [Cryptomeria japonica]|uniref:uncharacterized protein LOC131062846 isoform X2 n=1 Tax=Cryptomeria japonica TaxID=3369 RepID=UPI0027DA8352|nr:uncharacterized protein LOC131062846 isoform X2 [Cryptomeria japonica]